jgi:hypothetical protein
MMGAPHEHFDSVTDLDRATPIESKAGNLSEVDHWSGEHNLATAFVQRLFLTFVFKNQKWMRNMCAEVE